MESSFNTENNLRRESKERLLNNLRRLIGGDLPNRIIRNKNKEPLKVFGKEGVLTFFVSNYTSQENPSLRMVYIKELDLRTYTSVYIPSLAEYFSVDELLVIDVTDEGIGEEERFDILEGERIEESSVVMIRDTQFEYEEEMYDEYYFFLVDLDNDSFNK